MIVSCFGKLPISPEFIRVNATGQALEHMDLWIQEGISQIRTHQGPTWAKAFVDSGTLAFVFSPPGLHEFLVGIMMPSQDRARRTFPLLIFLRMNREEWQYPVALAGIICHDFLQHAKNIAEEDWKHSDLSTFKSKVQSLPLPSQSEIDSYLESYENFLTNSHFLNDSEDNIKIGVSESEDDLQKLVKVRIEAIQESLDLTRNGDVRLPMVPSASMPPFVQTFWVEWIQQRINSNEISSSFFWNIGEAPVIPSLFVMSHTPTAKSFRQLIDPMPMSVQWFEIVFSHDQAVEQDDLTAEIPLPREQSKSNFYLGCFLERTAKSVFSTKNYEA